MNQVDGCIKFSRESWHYRLLMYVIGNSFFEGHYWSETKNDVVYYPINHNLCPYLRTVIAALVLVPFLFVWRHAPQIIRDHQDIGRAVIFWAFISLTVQLLWLILDPSAWYVFLIIFFGGVSVALMIGAFLFTGYTIKDKIVKRPHKKHKTSGLIKAYVSAKHNKICPCVEFEEL